MSDSTDRWLNESTETPPEKRWIFIANIEVKPSEWSTSDDPRDDIVFEEEALGIETNSNFNRTMKASDHRNSSLKRYTKSFLGASKQIGVPGETIGDMLGAVLCIEMVPQSSEIDGETRTWDLPQVFQRFHDPDDPVYDKNNPDETRPERAIAAAIEHRNRIEGKKNVADTTVASDASSEEVVAKILEDDDLRGVANLLGEDALVTAIKNKYDGVSTGDAKNAAKALKAATK